MQIIVNTQAFADVLRRLNGIVPAKPALPLLAHALVQAEMGALHFYATDHEIGLSTACPADVRTPGAVALPVKRTLDIAEQLPDADLLIEQRGAHVHLTCGAFRGRLQAMPADGFSSPPQMAGELAALPCAALLAMINRVHYCIADKGTKFTISGALLTVTEKVVALVATDGKRLSVATMPGVPGEAKSMILPAKCLDAITSIFSGPTIAFVQSGNHLFFADDRHLLASRMLEGQFPAYDRIIPKDVQNKAVLERAALASALRRVGQVAGDSMATYFDFSEDGLEITSSSAEVGDAAERVPAAYQGVKMRICCSWSYVLNFLDASEGQAATLSIKDEKSPLLLTDGPDHLSVIMTMRA